MATMVHTEICCYEAIQHRGHARPFHPLSILCSDLALEYMFICFLADLQHLCDFHLNSDIKYIFLGHGLVTVEEDADKYIFDYP
jgi:hypothetical protein